MLNELKFLNEVNATFSVDLNSLERLRVYLLPFLLLLHRERPNRVFSASSCSMPFVSFLPLLELPWVSYCLRRKEVVEKGVPAIQGKRKLSVGNL